MRPTTGILAALALATVISTPSALSSQDVPRPSKRTAVIHTVPAKAVEGVDYEIIVSVPVDYESSTERYPAVYYLDAWYNSGGVEETYHWLRAFDDIPPLILVGVSWKTDGAGALFCRTRDFTPTEDTRFHSETANVSGGGEAFLSFLTDELMPLIDSEYRTDPSSRGFLGYSLGGLFGAWVLFNHPEIFDRYMLGSPYIRWDDQLILRQEAEYAANHADLNARVYSCSGTEDFVLPDFQALKERLESRNYRGLEFTAEIMPDETHTSLIPGCFSRAFRNLYGNR